MFSETDEKFMKRALELAQSAWLELDEVPIGCVIVRDGSIISEGRNLKESSKKATGHAEIEAIEDACEALESWRLNDCELYVTIEPCAMCAGAILQSRIRRVVFGAPEPKFGCVGSQFNLLNHPEFNHQPIVESGLYEEECRSLIQNFFSKKRN